MPRVAKPFVLKAEDRKFLREIANSTTEDPRLIERAKLILACDNNTPLKNAAEEVGVSTQTVGKWRDRYLKSGLDGLYDLERSGRTEKYGKDALEKILQVMNSRHPDGENWDGKQLSIATGIPEDAVWRLMRKQGVQLSRVRSWHLPIKTKVYEKAMEMVAIYLTSDECAFVLCVHREPATLLQYELDSELRINNGKLAKKIASAIKRRGGIDLAEALELVLLESKEKEAIQQKKKTEDLSAFLEEVIGDLPQDPAIAYEVVYSNPTAFAGMDALERKHPRVIVNQLPNKEFWLVNLALLIKILMLSKSKFSESTAIANYIERLLHESAAMQVLPFRWRKFLKYRR